MSKNITSVTWSATGLPAGLTINPANGEITGTPNVQPPVTVTPTITVKTNYGEDTKTITINIAVPESWRPSIDIGQEITVIADEAMTPYTVTGTNVVKTN